MLNYCKNESIIYYSLGNFISDQRRLDTNGGAMAYLEFIKKDNNIKILNSGYILVWTWKKNINNKYKYFNLPITEYDKIPDKYYEDKIAMKIFMERTRNLLKIYNQNVNECYFNNDELIFL